MGHFLQQLEIDTDASLHLLMTTRDMVTFISLMKNKSLDTFKIFKAKVENQLNKRILSVRSDRGGEFYGRNDGFGKQCPQYTMLDTPSMNDIVER